MRPPNRFGVQEENRTRIPVPVRRPATAAGPPSPRPAVHLSAVGNGAGRREAPRIVLRRDQGAGTRWTSEVREEAERVVALVEGGCHRSAVTGALLIYFEQPSEHLARRYQFEKSLDWSQDEVPIFLDIPMGCPNIAIAMRNCLHVPG